MTEENQIQAADVMPALAAPKDQIALPIDSSIIKRQKRAVNRLLREVLVRGVHYGPLVIPKDRKKLGREPEEGDFLYQGGAEAIATMFRLRPEYTIVDKTKQQDGGPAGLGFIDFTVRCDLYHMPTGMLVGSALGNCNSRERKYKERQVYPDKARDWEKEMGTLEERQKYNGGTYSVYMVPVDPYEIQHTLLTIAQKRAHTKNVRGSVAASDALRIDEDLAGYLGEEESPGMAPEDNQRATELRDKAKAANSASGLADALREAAGLSRQWSALPGNADPAFLRLVGLTTAGRTEKPQEMTLVEVSSIIDTMKRDMRAAGVEV